MKHLHRLLLSTPKRLVRTTKILPQCARRRHTQATQLSVKTLSTSATCLGNTSSPNVRDGLCEVLEDKKQSFVTVKWKDGKSLPFANIFLRDHCRCETCYNVKASNRLWEPCTIPLDVRPVNIDSSLDAVTIVWSDDHVSTYSSEYLQNVQEGLYEDVRYLEPKLWKSADMEKDLPTYCLNDIIENETSMVDWFLDLKQLGVTKITGAGKDIEVLDFCRDKMFGGYYKTTHYGPTFKVISKKDATNQAYTSEPLWPHVDLPHFEHMPGIQALHCIKQTKQEGGHSTLVDGFQAAEELKSIHPECYEFLTKYKVRYRDIGADYFGEFETFCERPIIDFRDGLYQAIYHINFQRDYGKHGSVEEIQMFYKSLNFFTSLLVNPNNQFRFKLNEGEILIFDNKRILHGRSGFQAKPVDVDNEKSGKKELDDVDRYLHGCYFDWDQIYLKIRPIKRRVEANLTNQIKLK